MPGKGQYITAAVKDGVRTDVRLRPRPLPRRVAVEHLASAHLGGISAASRRISAHLGVSSSSAPLPTPCRRTSPLPTSRHERAHCGRAAAVGVRGLAPGSAAFAPRVLSAGGGTCPTHSAEVSRGESRGAELGARPSSPPSS
mmetsp:Transcript_15778/g.53089  ORF Transcript_15778/g.53089 Transcript_15778/m.53089 type:complete len:142 (-) Transcript_15778:933-1358(-)